MAQTDGTVSDLTEDAPSERSLTSTSDDFSVEEKLVRMDAEGGMNRVTSRPVAAEQNANHDIAIELAESIAASTFLRECDIVLPSSSLFGPQFLPEEREIGFKGNSDVCQKSAPSEECFSAISFPLHDEKAVLAQTSLMAFEKEETLMDVGPVVLVTLASEPLSWKNDRRVTGTVEDHPFEHSISESFATASENNSDEHCGRAYRRSRCHSEQSAVYDFDKKSGIWSHPLSSLVECSQRSNHSTLDVPTPKEIYIERLEVELDSVCKLARGRRAELLQLRADLAGVESKNSILVAELQMNRRHMHDVEELRASDQKLHELEIGRILSAQKLQSEDIVAAGNDWHRKFVRASKDRLAYFESMKKERRKFKETFAELRRREKEFEDYKIITMKAERSSERQQRQLAVRLESVMAELKFEKERLDESRSKMSTIAETLELEQKETFQLKQDLSDTTKKLRDAERRLSAAERALAEESAKLQEQALAELQSTQIYIAEIAQLRLASIEHQTSISREQEQARLLKEESTSVRCKLEQELELTKERVNILQSSSLDAEERVKGFLKTITELSTQLESVRQEYIYACEKEKDSAVEVANLSQKLVNEHAARGKLEIQTQSLERTVSEKEASLEQAINEIQSLRNLIEDRKDNADSASTKIQDLTLELCQCAEKLYQQEKTLIDNEGRLLATEKDLLASKDQIKKLTEKLETSHTNESSLSTKVQHLHSLLDEKASELQTLKKRQLEESAKLNENINTYKLESESLRDSLESCRTQLEIANQKTANFTRKCSDLNKTLQLVQLQKSQSQDEAIGLRADIQQMRSEITETERIRSHLEEELDRANHGIADISKKLEGAEERILNSLKVQEELKQQCQQKETEYEIILNEKNSLSAELDALKRKYAATMKQIEADLDSEKEKGAKVLTTLQAAQREVFDLREAAKLHEKSKATWESDSKILAEERANLKGDVAKLRKEIQIISAKTAADAEKLEEFEHRSKELESHKMELAKLVSTLTEEVNLARVSLTDSESVKAHLTMSNSQITGLLQDALVEIERSRSNSASMKRIFQSLIGLNLTGRTEDGETLSSWLKEHKKQILQSISQASEASELAGNGMVLFSDKEIHSEPMEMTVEESITQDKKIFRAFRGSFTARIESAVGKSIKAVSDGRGVPSKPVPNEKNDLLIARIKELEEIVGERDRFIQELLDAGRQISRQNSHRDVHEGQKIGQLVKRLQSVIEDSASLIGREKLKRLIKTHVLQ